MQIRRFRAEDGQVLLEVFLSSVRGIASLDYSVEQIKAWAPQSIDTTAWQLHISKLQPFVVEIEGVIAGYADIQSNGYIDHFFVPEAYARKGVGSLLMKHIHTEAQRLGINVLSADVSKTAEPFFLRHGFALIERRFPVRQGVVLENALMEKKLAHAA